MVRTATKREKVHVSYRKHFAGCDVGSRCSGVRNRHGQRCSSDGADRLIGTRNPTQERPEVIMTNARSLLLVVLAFASTSALILAQNALFNTVVMG